MLLSGAGSIICYLQLEVKGHEWARLGAQYSTSPGFCIVARHHLYCRIILMDCCGPHSPGVYHCTFITRPLLPRSVLNSVSFYFLLCLVELLRTRILVHW